MFAVETSQVAYAQNICDIVDIRYDHESQEAISGILRAKGNAVMVVSC